MIDNPVIEDKEKYFGSFIPEWFDRSILRSYFSASVLSKHFGIGGFAAQSFIQKRLAQGRPVPSITQASNNVHGKVTLYKVLDVLVCAKADCLEITQPKEKTERVQAYNTTLLDQKAAALRQEISMLEAKRDELSSDIRHLLGDFSDISPSLTQLKYQLIPKDIIINKSNENFGRACGIYFLIKDNEIVYIGQSVNIASRLTQHKDKNFDSISFVLCDKSELDILETLYIFSYRPVLNGVMKIGNTGETKISTPISLQNLIAMFKKAG